jgi:hypothetical protein
LLLVLALVLILAQTMGSASAEPKAGHSPGGSKGAHPPVELTLQVTHHAGSAAHPSRSNGRTGSGEGQSGDRSHGPGGSGGQNCGTSRHSEVTQSSGHERADIASPITLPASTIPTTTVPRTTPTTQPPRPTTTVTTTVPATTPATTPTTTPATTPASPPTVPPTVPPSPPPSVGAASGGTATSPALGGAASIQGVAALQVAANPTTAAPAAAKGAKGKSAASGASAPTVGGVFDEPMVIANGGWKGLSLRAATNLKVPILFAFVVALFVLGQALIDRRDPKMSRAPERNDEDTVGFQ